MFRSNCRAPQIVLFLSFCVWLQSPTKLVGQLVESFDQTVSPSLVEVLGDLNVDSTLTAAASEKLTIEGQVIDEHGLPTPNALVVCWTKNWKGEYLVLGRTLSNQDGRYAVDGSGLRRIANEAENVDFDKRLEFEKSQMSVLYGMLNLRDNVEGENLNNYPVNLIAVGPNNCMGQAVPQVIFSQSRIDCNLHLNDSAGEVVGKVVGTNGEPVSGVTISLNWLGQKIGDTSSISLIPAQFQTVTASDGKFAFRQLPSDYIAVIRLSNSDHAARAEWVATSRGASFPKQEMVGPNSSLFTFTQPLTKRVFGKVADLNGTQVEGVAIRIGTHRTTTNSAGEYSLEAVPETEQYIQALCPADSRFATAGAYLDWNACLKGEPQRTIQAHEGVWVTGRVVSAHDRRAISNVSIKTESQYYCGMNNPDGSFRCRVFPAAQQLRLVPAWLTEHEQQSAASYPISVTPKQDLSLGDLPLSVGDELAEIDVRVVLPSGEPAKECIVRLRSANRRGVYLNRTLKVNDAWTTAAVADSFGNCRFRPAVHLDSTEYLSVAYPEVDPQYFGEVALSASQTKAEVRLESVQPIRGKVAFNGQPFSGARLMVRTVGEAEVSFKSFRFEGTSDSSGNYEVLVPRFKSYEISLLQGVHHYGIKDGIGNDPISIIGNDEPMIPGPSIEVLQGTGTISGHVLGTNMRGYSGARINLRPAAGKVVIGFFSQDSNGSDGAFRVGGIPEGTFEFFASNHPPQAKRTPESDVVQAKSGDKDVKIKMIRNSRGP